MDWGMHRTVGRRAIRLQIMLAQLDVDATALVCLERGDVYVKSRSMCLSCHESDACLR